jgi:predicted RNase H-like nuclease (RuvC/YqgF family)
MMKINKAPSECKCSKCVLNQQQIVRLNKELIELDDKRVRQSIQHEHEVSELNDEYSYLHRLLEGAKAEVKRLKAEHSQSKKNVLEEVGQPESNTHLRASSSLNW